MIIVSDIILAIYITHMYAHQNRGRVWVERPNVILFGSNVPMLYCLKKYAFITCTLYVGMTIFYGPC